MHIHIGYSTSFVSFACIGIMVLCVSKNKNMRTKKEEGKVEADSVNNQASSVEQDQAPSGDWHLKRI